MKPIATGETWQHFLAEGAARDAILVLDGWLVAPLGASGHALASAYFSDLLTTTEMKPLAPLSVSEAADLSLPGFSAIQELTTSHASFHYFAPTGAKPRPRLHLDLFSCRAFDVESVVQIAARHFGLGGWSGTFVLRSVDSAERQTWELAGEGSFIHERCQLVRSQGQGRLFVGPRGPVSSDGAGDPLRFGDS